MLTALRGIPGRALVGVESVDALTREGLPKARVELVGERRKLGLAGRLVADIGDLLAVEQIVPGGNTRGDPSMLA
jgi:hypothetical protein